MQSQTVKESRRRKSTESFQSQKPAVPKKEAAHSLPGYPHDDVQAHIADRAYALYAERGYRQGHALDDWLEAEREILGLECNA
ncbi:MAG: DUF2934 domain-containing protein [Nitrospira sp.]|nr:DUF2934 domain-containing protein [Nitrospira sp.]MBH0183568.1 DUF2934 domain-containing protein [Nitrospira sp.]MBH0185912.1 DUF2934 domain-containing protein [Nitrospira sp.]MBH0197238.1 DUF2934 domain-containing protein [Nitrospira sp.]